MDDKELHFILQEGEGLKIEFKESLKHIDEEMVAFANSSGGRIFLGVSDNGKVKGIDVTNKLKSQIQDLARNCDPEINVKIENFNDVLVINVPVGKDKPYKCKPGFFLRVGANSQKMSRDQILKMVVDEGKVKFDEQINNKFNFKKDFDDKKFEEFLKIAELTENIPKLDILNNLGLISDKKITNAGILFFAKKPIYFLRQAEVSCVRFKGKERIDIIDRVNLSSGLIENINEAIKFVQRNTRLSYQIKSVQRKEIPEYPPEAIRESIINSLMHRNYFEKGSSVSVEIFDDRIEISNPGGLPKGLDENEFGRKGVRRNPLIADLLYRVRYVEKAGTGINRIKKSLREAGLKPPKIEFNGFFTMTFYSNVSLNVPLNVPLNERQKKVLYLIYNGKVNLNMISEKLSVNRRTIQRDIEYLVKHELIERVGSKKAGYYKKA